MLMRQLAMFILIGAANTLQAAEPLLFKKDEVASIPWVPYGLVFFILISTVFILAKNLKKTSYVQANFKVIEKIAVHHKTKLYVIDYQGQKFLVADNQNSLAIQALQEINVS
jgi:hypothetical protein